MAIFFEVIKERVKEDKLFLVGYYGASTVSFEHVFPNWGEIIRYVLKCELNESLGDDFEHESWWNLQTFNFGLTGATSRDLLKRYYSLILSKKPDLIFLYIGKNDAYQKIDREETKSNTRKIIQKALDKNIKVVFASSVPSSSDKINEKIKYYVEADREVAKDFKENDNFIFVDFFNLFPKNELKNSYTLIMEEDNEDLGLKKNRLDAVHYNRYGNALVAKILLKEVFGIQFNHEKFLKDIMDNSIKYPSY